MTQSFAVTIFPDVHAARAKTRQLSMDELTERLRNVTSYPDKNSCPLIKLARFGEQRSDKNSLRHDANVIEITGVEADYDGGVVTFGEAQTQLADAGLSAVLYTSPSHSVLRPRWRVLCPTSRPYPPGDRARFVARLNGALGGILAPESFTLSQAFYVGRVCNDYAVAQVNGRYIDEAEDLDARAVAPVVNGDSRAERLAKLRSTDAVVRRLFERNLVLRQRPDGGADIICPFEAEHTTPRATGDCSYFAPHTGGFAKAHFHCLHSHCASRSDEEFMRAIGLPIERMQCPVPAVAEDRPSADCRRTTDAETIAQLASLSALEYDRIRFAEAETLGVRVQTLDEQVKRARGNRENDKDGFKFPEVEPWPDPVDGKDLLDSLAASCQRFIVLPPRGDTALALWVLFTHLIEAAEVAPILALLSPEKRCGKTTCVDWLLRLVRRPMPASNISPPALFRAVEAWRPTLLIDEADSFAKENEELRGILNSGHTRTTAFVVRTVGDDHEPKAFSTWAAKLIALIGKLPDTLHDRAISVELRRKLPSERVEKLRHAEPGEFDTLARQCVRFAQDNAGTIRAARPAIPDELNDRAADNWESLLAIADVAGGTWPKLAREAASALSGASPDGDSTKIDLLRDVRAVFERLGVDRIASADLAAALAEDKESRWAEFYKGKPITLRQVARLLGAFGIVPGTIRLPNGTTPRGYLFERFHDAFDRYIPPFQVQHRHNPILARVSGENASATEGALFRIANPPQPKPGVACGGVADENPLLGGEQESEAL